MPPAITPVSSIESCGFTLKKGLDAAKDQSYVLFGMGQDELSRTLMPVGSYSKETIRQLALEADFPNAEKPDSQDICFIPFGDYKAFLEERVATTGGDIVDQDGNVFAQHKGIEFFTVGQRRGLGITGAEPMYVLRVEPETNRVVVGPEQALYQDSLTVSRVNYVAGTPPADPMPVKVKIRYKFEEAPAVLHPSPQGPMYASKSRNGPSPRARRRSSTGAIRCWAVALLTDSGPGWIPAATLWARRA